MTFAHAFDCVVALLALSSLLSAEEPATPNAASQAERCIRQLQSDEFAIRREARESLMQLGLVAVPLLQQSAQGPNAGQVEECISLLAWFSHQADVALSHVATEALMELAQVESRTTSQLAKSALAPATPVIHRSSAGPGRLNLALPGGVRPRPVIPQGEAEFDDRGRHIKVVAAENGTFTIRVTETIDGEKQTTEIQANNLAELLRKNRDAIRWYAEFRRRQVLAQRPRPVHPGPAEVQNQVERVQVLTFNGHQTIDVIKNGKHVCINSEAGRNIRATVGETVDGQETTRTIQAADLAELQVAAPEVAAIYEQYGARLVLRRSRPQPPLQVE
ncbi:MAG: hypothetical protein ACK5Q5_11975 [Planctomycetaceae bacterium]